MQLLYTAANRAVHVFVHLGLCPVQLPQRALGVPTAALHRVERRDVKNAVGGGPDLIVYSWSQKSKDDRLSNRSATSTQSQRHRTRAAIDGSPLAIPAPASANILRHWRAISN